jgi:phage I-like protein
LDGLDALSARAALSRSIFSTPQNPIKEPEMDKDQQIAALTQELAALKEKLTPAATSVAALTSQVAALTSERDTAKAALAAVTAQAEKDKHGELMTAALSDGRLAPALKPWAEKQSLAALTEFLDTTAPLVNKERQAPKGEQGVAGLSEVELAACTRMGVTPEAFLAAKK